MNEQERSKLTNSNKKELILTAGNENIAAHIENHIGKADIIYHEHDADQIHVDIYHIKPNEKYPYHVLVTSGMSDRPMNTPPEMHDYRYAEVCMILPSHWPLNSDGNARNEFEDETVYWPLRWLKKIARLPHENNSWIGWGHTIPNGEQVEPFAPNTKLGCMLMLPSLSFPEDFCELRVDDNKSIQFFCAYPIYKEEMVFKLEHGLDKLLDRFDDNRVTDVVSLDRKNCGDNSAPESIL